MVLDVEEHYIGDVDGWRVAVENFTAGGQRIMIEREVWLNNVKFGGEFYEQGIDFNHNPVTLKAYTPVIFDEEGILTYNWFGKLGTDFKTDKGGWSYGLGLSELSRDMEKRIGYGLGFPTHEKLSKLFENQFAEPLISEIDRIRKQNEVTDRRKIYELAKKSGGEFTV